MNTLQRIDIYVRQNQGARLTHRQRRRAVKKAGPDPYVTITRDSGMGYGLGMQGFREITNIRRAEPGQERPF